MRDRIRLLDRIAHGVDVRIARLIGVVHRDPTLWPELQPGQLGQPDIGPDTDGSDDQVGREDLTVGQCDRSVPDRGHRHPQRHPDAVGGQFVTDEYRQLGIERRQYLGSGFDDPGVQPLRDQVLGHFESDETRADHHGRLRGHIDLGGDGCGILHGAEGPGPVIAGDRGPHRGRSHAEDQLVVRHDGLLPADGGACRHHVCDPVDRHDLVVDPDVETESVEELLRRL